MLPGLAPASTAMSRIDTALKPCVENSSSAALKIASRMLGFRVIRFAFHALVLYVCTNNKVRSTNIWTRELVHARDHHCVFDRHGSSSLARFDRHRGRSGTARDPGADGRAAGRALYGHADFDPAGASLGPHAR